MVLKIEVGNDKVPFIHLGSHQLRLDLEDLNEREKERAAIEIRETPENVRYGLSKLKELLGAEENLYLPLDNEAFLMKFLRPCRFYPEKAFTIIKTYYKFKVRYPKYGVNITPHSVRHAFDNGVYTFLPSRSDSGSRIMIINCGTKWNPKEVRLEDLFRAMLVSIEIAMLEPKTQLGGVHVILDAAGLSLVHAYEFSPSTAKLILEWVQDCAPIRLKGIHIINQPYIFNMVYAIFKPFIGDRLRKVLCFHGTNRKSLTDKISKECLPEYYGGTADIPELPGTLFSQMLFYYEESFKVHNSYGYGPDQKIAEIL